jgi:hypothetical protein
MRNFRRAIIDPATASIIIAVITVIGTVIVDKESDRAVTNFIYNIDSNKTVPCEGYYINPSDKK